MKTLFYKSYLLMSVALGITAVTSWLSYTSGFANTLTESNSKVFGIFMAQLLLIVLLVGSTKSKKTIVSLILFILFSMSIGLTLGLMFLSYSVATISVTALATALTFLGTSFIGFTTGVDLSGAEGYLVMGLIGLIIGSALNTLFIPFSLFYWGLTYFGIGLFLVIAIRDTQRIKELANDGFNDWSTALLCATTLYLDFINLLLLFLRFGKKD